MNANTCTLCLQLCPTGLLRSFVQILLHTVKLTPNSEQTGPKEFVILSLCPSWKHSSMTTDSDSRWSCLQELVNGRNENVNGNLLRREISSVYLTVDEFLSHSLNGDMGLQCQCCSAALRGLWLVCYSWCLVNSDKEERERVAGVRDTARQGETTFWGRAARNERKRHVVSQDVICQCFNKKKGKLINFLWSISFFLLLFFVCDVGIVIQNKTN